MPAKRTKTKRTTKSQPARRIRPIHIHLSLTALVLLVLGAFIAVDNYRNPTAYAGPPAAPSGKTWQMAWNDEFDGSGIDTSKWNIQNNSNYGASNREDQCYRAANVTVSGGALRLSGKRETVTCGGTNPDTGNSTYYFTSGMVTTRAQGGSMKFKFKQGYAEARAKAPKGNPFWPAFWLVSPNDGSTPGWPDYGEFDIFEMYGVRPDSVQGTLHYKCTSGDGHCKTAPTIYNIKADSAYGGNSNLGEQITTQSAMDAYSGGTNDYNTYGFLWEADRITWYVNGRKVRYFDGTNLYRIEQNGSQTLENTTASMGQPAIPFSTVFGYDHSINLNLAIGGNGPQYSAYGYTGQDSAGGYSNGNLVMHDPGHFEVDYVRVYQLADQPAPDPDPEPDPTPDPGNEQTPPPSSEPKTPSTDTTTKKVVTTPSGDTVTIGTEDTTISGDTVLTPELATDEDLQQKVARVEYYANGKLVMTLTKPPYTLDTKKLPNGKHRITERIYFKDGTKQEKTVEIQVKNASKTLPETVSDNRIAITVLGLLLIAIVTLLVFPAVRRRLFGLVVRRFNKLKR